MGKSWSATFKIAIVFPSTGVGEENKKQCAPFNCDLQEFGFSKDLAGLMSRTIDRVMNKSAKVCVTVNPLWK